MAAKLKKVIASVLVALLLVPMLGCLAGVPLKAQAAEKEYMGHKLVAENDNYALYVKEEGLAVIVLDKATGACMESAVSYDDGRNNDLWMGAMQSALVLNLIYSNVDTQQADLINDDITQEVTYTDNGFSAKVYWNKYKLGMTLEVTLNEDGITARIPDDSIVEEGEAYIGTIALYPYLGYSYLDEKDGYMFLPDGNGALIYLDDKEGRFNTGYTGVVYGMDAGFEESDTTRLWREKYEMVNEANNVLVPVFGMAHTSEGIAYLAVIEEGDQRVTIEGSPNGVSIDYNRIFARFTERRLYTQPVSNNSTSGSFRLMEADRSHSDLQVRYLFLNGDNANYCGMAKAYRNYLLDSGFLTRQPDEFRTRVDFLGTEREAWIVGTSAVVMTTVEDVREIYADLEQQGVTDLLSVYKGWQKGGLYNLPITKYKADSKIGGTKSLTELLKESESKGIKMYLYNDAMRINPDEQNASFNVVKKINKRKQEEDTYKDVYEEFMWLTPARTDYLLDKFIKSYTKSGVNSLALGGITDTLYSYNYSGTFYTRHQCAESYYNTVAKADESADLVLQQPFAYLWNHTESFLDMPLYTSSYIFEDESVPFLSIVLKGVMPVYSEYVNFEANKEEFFLKMVETGTCPSFYITKESSADLIYTNSSDVYSSEYNVYRDDIVSYAKELAAVHEATAGASIVEHEIRDNGITVVTYDNGVKIYLNYSTVQQSADGYTLEGMSYEVTKN
ncbi:MAG: DUF5696 domain-containing protein [Butyrivibrio sp.]|nr:DUF5696 domain-containing protein [Acetatifactor muris]MCM1558328.1 DUF5696 domain-containing protein [Butyrivibrio sp.]